MLSFVQLLTSLLLLQSEFLSTALPRFTESESWVLSLELTLLSGSFLLSLSPALLLSLPLLSDNGLLSLTGLLAVLEILPLLSYLGRGGIYD